MFTEPFGFLFCFGASVRVLICSIVEIFFFFFSYNLAESPGAPLQPPMILQRKTVALNQGGGPAWAHTASAKQALQPLPGSRAARVFPVLYSCQKAEETFAAPQRSQHSHTLFCFSHVAWIATSVLPS